VTRARVFALVIATAELASACGPSHIRPFTPRDRKYEAGEYAATQKTAKPSMGSIYSEGQPGYLEDTRALRVGDIVQITIDEEANATGGASTNLSKSSDNDTEVNALLGIVPAIKKAYPSIDPTKLLNFMSKSDFAGQGTTQRAGTLTGSIGVRVKQELPNGDLFIEGTKVVMINHEEYHLYISGVIRTADIQQDNSVNSALVADARVEFTGRGDINDQTERGWLTAIIDAINPF
jgi:flagellar L-ring protein precursor FlgH